ncbi:endoplasmic reticulum metallopeptidase 1 [Cucurbitaria berberidis CBS 394.84]|uniref:Peptide hydrolase n=1 Tax=Cucurbitaria berberidis CBS 394.84 TaxID=1168544 RepID=A0A9P4GEF0_9PLEO|nr:endoplasmic reticulum metallopeptidase 1 [Cucurbitaria berberidis CBS 394.84]KAF1844483.1 endoplasmic reticulum metallopeptidase 1 [Cucurbitaria berberidis CBS 394.84]
MAFLNPFSFTPGPVIFFTTVTYIALFAALLTVHLRVPNSPSNPPAGTNLTQAWDDLEHITRRFHPYNSHANDDVRSYLLSRIKHIVASKELSKDQVQVIDDTVANATFSSGPTSVYFEGTNIIVTIRGSDDDQPFGEYGGPLPAERRPDNGGVLVNAHYDSVSTGYGATDDGVGVVTVLQLLAYFTESENWPKRTVVLLLNNGEEDFLNGAKAFMRNSISRVPRTFVNLEGAGAGGRATLFRSTDTEVTRFYRKSSHPFGTVVSGDGFKKGLIRSETDYKVFHGELGLRGLDIAFMEPRARYHTVEDSTRETSMNSLWHMLSAALASTSGLASVSNDEFGGSGDDSSHGDDDAETGSGSDAVWFDIFGKVFVVFQLHTLFALCVTLLVVAPLTLIGLTVGLSKAGKNYLLARRAYVCSSDDDHPVHLYGWRGFFRFPIVLVIATAAVVGLAYLIVRVNPFIVYSSPYAVWSMMLSAWFAIAWFFLRGADAMRPSALQRMYALIWLFIGSFAILALVTVLVNNYHLAAGYPALFYFAAIFFAILISYLELFFAPSKSAYARHFDQIESPRPNSESGSRPLTGTTSAARSDDRPAQDDDATETTSLLRGDRRSFARYGGRRESTSEGGDDHEPGPRRLDLGHEYPGEQEWSSKLPSWLWIVQFVPVATIAVTLVGQISLLLTSALYQTPSDGNSPLFIYISFAVLTVLLLAPTAPFIHRFTYHIPTFLFLVCVATVIYNLVAFPFSREHRLKVYFVQRVNCETGINTVSLTGLDGYIQRIVGDLPSAQGRGLNCTTPDVVTRKELKTCEWEGIPAKVIPKASPFSNKTRTDSWLSYSIQKGNSTNKATIHVVGRNTRSCRIVFDTPISDLAVAGAVSDPRFRPVGETGSLEVRLWHREWSQPWDVDVTWNAKEQPKLSGRIVCLWSDANAGEIPALDELQHYLPVWAIPSKISDGLVEGFKHFDI